MFIRLILILIILILSSAVSFSSTYRVTQIPNGVKFACLNCHLTVTGRYLNSFGRDINDKFLNNGNVIWGPELALLDSDGDGFTNGDELQDHDGKWKFGDQDPGNFELVSQPGDSSNKPSKISNIDSYSFENVHSELLVYPNPTNHQNINIEFNNQKDADLMVGIYNSRGQRVIILDMNSSNGIRIWDLKDDFDRTVPNGIYTVVVMSKDKIRSQQIVFDK